MAFKIGSTTVVSNTPQTDFARITINKPAVVAVLASTRGSTALTSASLIGNELRFNGL